MQHIVHCSFPQNVPRAGGMGWERQLVGQERVGEQEGFDLRDSAVGVTEPQCDLGWEGH